MSPDDLPPSGLAWDSITPSGTVSQGDGPDGRYIRLHFSGGGQEGACVFGPGGGKVWIGWNEAVALEDVITALLGPIFGCVLRLQGRTFLHGSAVAFGERVVAFLGGGGAGKSTTALALVQRGASMVSDDLVLLEETAGGFNVPAGPPSLRLLPDALTALGGPLEALSPVGPDESRSRKVSLPIPRVERTAEALRLQVVYVLGDRQPAGPRCALTPMGWADTLGTLMAHRSGTFLLDHAGHRRDLGVLGRLARTVPVCRVLRREGLDGLGEIEETLLSDIHRRWAARSGTGSGFVRP